MDLQLRDEFTELWKKYFNHSDLPISFYYSQDPGDTEIVTQPKGHKCIIGYFAKVQKGKSLAFNKENIGCRGGKKYTGYQKELGANFNYFLSCGIPGELEGERYKKTPEIVDSMMRKFPLMEAPEKWLIFKRWDKLEENDNPEVVIFLDKADVISGLFTLANFDFVDPYGVVTPFSSGCGSTIFYPYLEKEKEKPRSFIGMFDPSARAFAKKDLLSFATPFKRFVELVKSMEESFLVTKTWETVQKRVN